MGVLRIGVGSVPRVHGARPVLALQLGSSIYAAGPARVRELDCAVKNEPDECSFQRVRVGWSTSTNRDHHSPSREVAMSEERTYLELSEAEGSHKFYEAVVQGKELTIRFGRIGDAGQTSTKTFASPEAARAEAQKKIAEKTRKGYHGFLDDFSARHPGLATSAVTEELVRAWMAIERQHPRHKRPK